MYLPQNQKNVTVFPKDYNHNQTSVENSMTQKNLNPTVKSEKKEYELPLHTERNIDISCFASQSKQALLTGIVSH
jgi:hypothetical protein